MTITIKLIIIIVIVMIVIIMIIVIQLLEYVIPPPPAAPAPEPNKYGRYGVSGCRVMVLACDGWGRGSQGRSQRLLVNNRGCSDSSFDL